MPDQPDILALIDGAIEDWETSGDAMRWRPEGSPGAQKPMTLRDHMRRDRNIRALETGNLDQLNLRHVDPAQMEAFVRAMLEAATAAGETIRRAWEAYKPAVERLGKVVVDLAETLEGIDGTGLATPAAVSPRVPVYQDARPRWQSPYGPARRR